MRDTRIVGGNHGFKASTHLAVTYDVDAITEITSYADYSVFSEKLRQLGFTEDASKERLFAVGGRQQPRSISCLSMSEFLDFRERLRQLAAL